MQSGTDMRIPVVFGGQARPDEAVLVEDGQNMPAQGYALRFSRGLPGHALGCACCTLRGPAADALGKLFRERATGAAPFFKQVRVLASAAGEAMVRDAIAEDIVTRARYHAD
ncbi:MAG: hypothetical protein B7Z81_12040 [Acidocella sp. 20-61-6]|nr:MAG: hypothetical protein B7Z81_12040 [Acidocella sp. 20-61-6]